MLCRKIDIIHRMMCQRIRKVWLTCCAILVHMRVVYSAVFFLSIFSSVAQDISDGGDLTPKYSNEFMNIGIGARSFGMGFTAISFVDDVTSGYWNPAGLNDLSTSHQLGLMHSSYFGGLANYDYIGFATSVDEESKIGLSLLRFSVDDIPDTRFLIDVNGAINYDNIEFFASADYAFLLSYARVLPLLGGIKAGGNLKVIHRTVGDFSHAWGFGFDVGLQKQVGNWKLGLVARDILGTFNAWSHNAEEVEDIYVLTGNDVPLNSLEVTLPRLVLGGSTSLEITDDFSLMSSLDLDMTFDGRRNTLVRTDLMSLDPKGGVEIQYKGMAFLRFGASQLQKIKRFDRSEYWTVQPNLGLGIIVNELTIDYALTDIGNLAPGLFSHVFSIKVDFNNEKK